MQDKIDRKERTLTLRVDAQMFNLLKKKADEDMRTVSSYIRKVLNESVKPKSKK